MFSISFAYKFSPQSQFKNPAPVDVTKGMRSVSVTTAKKQTIDIQIGMKGISIQLTPKGSVTVVEYYI